MSAPVRVFSWACVITLEQIMSSAALCLTLLPTVSCLPTPLKICHFVRLWVELTRWKRQTQCHRVHTSTWFIKVVTLTQTVWAIHDLGGRGVCIIQYHSPAFTQSSYMCINTCLLWDYRIHVMVTPSRLSPSALPVNYDLWRAASKICSQARVGDSRSPSRPSVCSFVWVRIFFFFSFFQGQQEELKN